MRIVSMHRRHNVAFDQPRTSAQQRYQALVIVLVEHRPPLLIFGIPLAEPGYGHSDYPNWQMGSLRRTYRLNFIPAASRSHVSAVRPRSRNLNFCTLPLSVRGNSPTNSTKRGIAK